LNNKIFTSYYAINKVKQKCLETEYAAELAAILGCRVEQQAGYNLGRIDLLSNSWLIEVKKSYSSTAVKGALGQLLVYHYSLGKPNVKLGLALISKLPSSGIRQFCFENNIQIFYNNLHTWSAL
jgi:hypothetical protein